MIYHMKISKKLEIMIYHMKISNYDMLFLTHKLTGILSPIRLKSCYFCKSPCNAMEGVTKGQFDELKNSINIIFHDIDVIFDIY